VTLDYSVGRNRLAKSVDNEALVPLKFTVALEAVHVAQALASATTARKSICVHANLDLFVDPSRHIWSAARLGQDILKTNKD